MKTRADVESLKLNWLRDPCYELEDTEGFEEHYAELLAFSVEKKAEWDERKRLRMAQIQESNLQRMTPLDYFAAAALTGIMAAGGTGMQPSAHIASNSYALGCAMMIQRRDFVPPPPPEEGT